MSYNFCNETEPVFDHSTQWVGKADEKYAFSSCFIQLHTPARKNAHLLFSSLPRNRNLQIMRIFDEGHDIRPYIPNIFIHATKLTNMDDLTKN